MTTSARPEDRNGPLGTCPWTNARCPLLGTSCSERESRACLLVSFFEAMREFSPQVAATVHMPGTEIDGEALAQRFKLSSRELEVLSCLFEMSSDEAIAGRLRISKHTVRDHRKAIYRKCEVSSFRELVRRVGFRVHLEPEPDSTRSESDPGSEPV